VPDSKDASTRVALLTPPGAGAIATLAVCGPDAWRITRSLFRRRLPEIPIPGTFYLGRLGAENNACDEVVLAVKHDGVELHCHGGVEVVRFIEELLTARGAVVRSWKELTSTTRLHLLAQEQLMNAPAVKTAAILLDQVHGAFERVLAEILACLQNNDHATAARHLSRLAQTQHLGRHLVQPFRVVIAGAPNVGKSSLVNALAGFTRSLVSPIPGTTRDIVTTQIVLGGWPVELVDTAGLRDSADVLEREGISRARAAHDQADLCLWVVEASAPARMPPEIAMSAMIVNKIDMPSLYGGERFSETAVRRVFETLLESWPSYRDARPPILCVSAKTGEGMSDLCQQIDSLLGLEEILGPGEGVAFTEALADQILLAHAAARAEDWSRAGRIVAGIHSSSCVPICSVR
jgi:tRNA modification GTPase